MKPILRLPLYICNAMYIHTHIFICVYVPVQVYICMCIYMDIYIMYICMDDHSEFGCSTYCDKARYDFV